MKKQEEEGQNSIRNLMKRGQIDEESSIKTHSNLFQISFDQNLLIKIFSIKINPDIARDSTKKFNAIINSARSDLTPFVGRSFIIAGRNIYSCQEGTLNQVKEACEVIGGLYDEKYSIYVEFVRSVSMQNVKSSGSTESIMPMNFMNTLVKKFFVELGYVEMGGSHKYFNPKSRKVLENDGLMLFNGYKASFTVQNSNLFLRVDSMTKIIQNKKVIDVINEIYFIHSNKGKEEKRNLLKETLIGKTVVGNYGNTKSWIIQDLEFGLNYDTFPIEPNSTITISQYYEKNYGMKIQNKKQPAIRSFYGRKKNKIPIILIPEFLLLSGMPDNYDEKKKREIYEHTILRPAQKFNRIQSLINSFNSNENEFINSVSQNLGIKISSQNKEISADLLPFPKIKLGNDDEIQENRVSSFQMHNRQLFETDFPVNIYAYIPVNYPSKDIESVLSSTSRSFGITYSLKFVKMNYDDGRAMNKIQKMVTSEKNEEHNINWFLIPNYFKKFYTEIKNLPFKEKKPKVNQVTLLSSLKKKNFPSILTKILLQMATKVGNVLWLPTSEEKNEANTIMMIGIHTERTKEKHCVIGYCGTIDEEMSKFHSDYVYEQNSVLPSKNCEILSNCLNAFWNNSKNLPTDIIIMKNGCSDNQINSKVQEIKELKKTVFELVNEEINIIYVMIDKRPREKFFVSKENHLHNPTLGTIINEQSNEKRSSFFLIPKNCQKSSVNPVHYQIIYNDSSLPLRSIQELLYTASFNYMNYCGASQVPAPLRYAEKLADMASQHLKKPLEKEGLNKHLFYI